MLWQENTSFKEKRIKLLKLTPSIIVRSWWIIKWIKLISNVYILRIIKGPIPINNHRSSIFVQSRERSISAEHPRHRVITRVRPQTRLSANIRTRLCNIYTWYPHAYACEYIIVHKYKRAIMLGITHVHVEQDSWTSTHTNA